jgi:hypothetical protein
VGYSDSILVNQNIKRGEILDVVRAERTIVLALVHILYRVGTLDKNTAIALSHLYDSRMNERQRELFERTKDELLPT